MVDPVWVDGTTPLNSANLTKLQTRDEKGAASGYATLDGTTKVPVAQLPDLSATYATKVSYGTTLPGSPVDGQEAILVNNVSDPGTFVWRFRYNAGSTNTYKWEFVGGGPAVAGDTSGLTVTPAGQWVTGQTPNLTIPRAGIYVFGFSCEFSPGSSTVVGMSVSVNGTVQSAIAEAQISIAGTVGVAVPAVPFSFAAGDALASAYYVGVSCPVNHRYLSLIPRRVS